MSMIALTKARILAADVSVLPFVFAQIIHVEVAMLLEPILMRLDGERPH